MPVPTAYTENTLAVFMHETLGEIAELIGWVATGASVGSYGLMIENALVAYGVSDISLATDIAKLRAAAKLAAWSGALTSLSTRYDFSSEQQSFKRSQMAEIAKVQLARAESESAGVGVLPGWSVEASSLTFALDPYTPATGEEVA